MDTPISGHSLSTIESVLNFSQYLLRKKPGIYKKITKNWFYYMKNYFKYLLLDQKS